MARNKKRTFEQDLMRIAIETELLKRDRPSLATRIIRVMADLVASQRPPKDAS